jgi:hypothetical protein
MKPYGRRNKIRNKVEGHQNCGICMPDNVKGRSKEKMEADKEIKEQLKDVQTRCGVVDCENISSNILVLKSSYGDEVIIDVCTKHFKLATNKNYSYYSMSSEGEE